MLQKIVAFGLDEEGEHVAWLACGHRQHVRHQPPYINRPWVLSPEGQAHKLGQPLNCVLCDQEQGNAPQSSKTPEKP